MQAGCPGLGSPVTRVQLPDELQATHEAAQAALQHTPSAHTVLAHSAPVAAKVAEWPAYTRAIATDRRVPAAAAAATRAGNAGAVAELGRATAGDLSPRARAAQAHPAGARIPPVAETPPVPNTPPVAGAPPVPDTPPVPGPHRPRDSARPRLPTGSRRATGGYDDPFITPGPSTAADRRSTPRSDLREVSTPPALSILLVVTVAVSAASPSCNTNVSVGPLAASASASSCPGIRR